MFLIIVLAVATVHYLSNYYHPTPNPPEEVKVE
jgi:hypothetical protein